MTDELLDKIEAAEAEAEGLRAEAAREARDIVKSVEEACLAEEREAMLKIRQDANQIIDQMRQVTQDEIRTLEVRRSAEREAMRGIAQARVDIAANAIFERIVLHGNR